ncbi:putative Cas4 nuclease [Halorubrum virus HRTV-11]|nr:putative Cas4 nuclease [Halorubrum virus HRTV-11]
MSRYNSHDATKDGEATTRAKPSKAEALPGIEPGTTLEIMPEVAEGGMPYISKSRIKTFVQCPAKFYWKYWCGERGPGSYYTEKGSRLHETFEKFHLNLFDYLEVNDSRPDRFTDLLPHWRNYSQWLDQVGAFFLFEERRWQQSVHEAAKTDAMMPYSAGRSLDDYIHDLWVPVEVEAEAWLGEPPESWVEANGEPDYVSGEPPVGDAPWMGRADLIVKTQSLPGVEGNGVTIIDYKTGSAPTVRYKDHGMLEQILNEGIYLEGEYYGWLFENFYDVDAVAGYYPGDDELVVSPYPNKDRRRLIKRAVIGMQREPDVEGNGPPENYPHEEQPLCNYSSGNCHFFNICPSTYGQ